jgi:hypothetical protein
VIDSEATLITIYNSKVAVEKRVWKDQIQPLPRRVAKSGVGTAHVGATDSNEHGHLPRTQLQCREVCVAWVNGSIYGQNRATNRHEGGQQIPRSPPEDARQRLVPRFALHLTMRLSDAGLHQRQTRALYPNHRLPPWLTEDKTRDRSDRLLDGVTFRPNIIRLIAPRHPRLMLSQIAPQKTDRQWSPRVRVPHCQHLRGQQILSPRHP